MVPEEAGGLEAQDGGHRVGVGIEEILISDAGGPGRARVESRHGFIIDSVITFVQHRTTLGAGTHAGETRGKRLC